MSPWRELFDMSSSRSPAEVDGHGCHTLLHIPAGCNCPISHEVMEDPVVAADGASYERRYIEEWFRLGNRSSPVTNLALANRSLTPNLALRSVIEEIQRLMPEVQQQQIKEWRARKDANVNLDAGAKTRDVSLTLKLARGSEVQVQSVRGAALHACRECNINPSKDDLRIQSIGRRGCILNVDEADSTAQVDINGVGTVWFAAAALRPVVRRLVADFAIGTKVLVNDSMHVVSKACRDCGFDERKDTVRLHSLGMMGHVMEVDLSDETVRVSIQSMGDIWFGAVALEPFVTLPISEFRVGLKVQVHDSMHVVLQACRDCNIVAKNDRLRLESLGQIGHVLNVDANDGTVHVSIKYIGSLWYGYAALRLASYISRCDARLYFAPASRVPTSSNVHCIWEQTNFI